MSAILGVWTPQSGRGSTLFALLSPGPPAGSSAEPHIAIDPRFAARCESPRTLLAAHARIDHRSDLLAVVADDCGALLGAWERWGSDALARIEGDFAFALFDRRARRLVLARDALGARPLFYRRIGGGLAFASSALPLAALDGRPQPDLAHLAGYLAGHPELGSGSFIAGVERVQPGHWVEMDGEGRITERRWWTPDLSPLRLNFGEAVDAVAAELRRSVSAMVQSGAPVVAADLSGGLDSSLVVTAAAALIGDPSRLIAVTGAPDGPVDPVTEWIADETPRAEATARMAGVRHIRAGARPQSPLAALERWLPTTQAPLGNACNLGWIDATYAAAREAGADTYLTGLHGNLTISRAGVGRLSALARSGRFIALGAELAAFHRNGRGSWAGLLGLAFGPWVPDRLWNRLAPQWHRRPADPFADALLHGGHPAVRRAARSARQAGFSAATLAEETASARLLAIRSIDDGVTQFSVQQRYGLELRDPTASRRMVELCLRLPAEHFYKDGQPRRLARRLLAGKAPDAVVTERQRGYQGANWRAGFEAARPAMLAEIDYIADDPELADMLDIPRMRQLLADWPTANWSDWSQIELYRNTLFRAIGAARFARFVREWRG